MPKFTVEDQEIEAHEHYTSSLRLQLVSGIGRVLAHECTLCKKMKLAESFRSTRGQLKSQCKRCVSDKRERDKASKSAERTVKTIE